MSALQQLKAVMSVPVKSSIAMLMFASLTAGTMAPQAAHASDMKEVGISATLGAVVGNAIGTLTGGEGHRTAGTVLGALVGGMAGKGVFSKMTNQDPAPVEEAKVNQNPNYVASSASSDRNSPGSQNGLSDRERSALQTKEAIALKALDQFSGTLNRIDSLKYEQALTTSRTEALEMSQKIGALEKQLGVYGNELVQKKNDFVATVQYLEKNVGVDTGEYRRKAAELSAVVDRTVKVEAKEVMQSGVIKTSANRMR